MVDVFRKCFATLQVGRWSVQTCFLAFLFVLGIHSAFAWVYAEHRDIALLAIQKLDPDRRDLLNKLWASARVGREAGVSFIGYGREEDRVLIPTPGIGLRQFYPDWSSPSSVRLPGVEYRPFRTFSLDQSSSFVFQLNARFDVPSRISVIEPVAAPEPDLGTVWYIGVRAAFDWRYCF